MTRNLTTSDKNYSNGSMSNNYPTINEWFSSFQDGKVSSTLNSNPKLSAEIHLAITKDYSEYISLICDHLFTLYHNVQHRPFVFQFLPSFVITYYDVLYNHHPESTDATTKDVCSTIDTFLVSLYNLSVTDDGLNEKVYEFRIPNLTLPSVYHTPNPDYYAPTPLTQHAISKHETKCDVIRIQSFTPFDSVNGLSREQILWFLLIQYGANVCFMDKYSRQSYLQMSKKLLGQGFSFNSDIPATKSRSALPPTGRRIQVSSRIMSEILGTLYYFKSNSSDNEANDCMRLLKQRAEYEMYADVLLMTESMEYLHEFDNQHPEKQDPIGIEIELAPTIDMVRQKRTATTTRSIKNRQRSSKQNDTTVVNENDITIEVPLPQKRIDENSNDNLDTPSTPLIDEVRSNISSSIGPAISTPSPTTNRQYKPVSLESTKAYFSTIQQQRSSPVLQLKTLTHNDDDDYDNNNEESLTILTRPYLSNNKQRGEKRDMIATVRFTSDKKDENGTNIETTYL